MNPFSTVEIPQVFKQLGRGNVTAINSSTANLLILIGIR